MLGRTRGAASATNAIGPFTTVTVAAGNRLAAQAGVADPDPEYLTSLRRRLADRPRP